MKIKRELIKQITVFYITGNVGRWKWDGSCIQTREKLHVDSELVKRYHKSIGNPLATSDFKLKNGISRSILSDENVLIGIWIITFKNHFKEQDI